MRASLRTHDSRPTFDDDERAGHCGTASLGGSCEHDNNGAWSMANVGSWDALRKNCSARCQMCKRCRYVSYSRHHRDCSWFAECQQLMHTVQGFRSAAVRAAWAGKETCGSLVQKGTLVGHRSSVAWHLASVSPGFRHFGPAQAQQCLRGAPVLLLGDSRLRYLYAGLVDLMLGGDATVMAAAGQPSHRACPIANDDGDERARAQCARFYMPKGENASYSFALNGTRLAFRWNRWAATGPDALKEALEEAFADGVAPTRYQQPPRAVLVNTGAWAVYSRSSPTTYGRPPTGRAEQRSDREAFYDGISRQLAEGVIKVAIGYPSCGWGGEINQEAFELPLRRHLRANGWMVYDPAELTSHQTWTNLQGAPAWSPQLLPWESLPNVTKRLQCRGPHTYDSLVDLEVQTLLNLLCVCASGQHTLHL